MNTPTIITMASSAVILIAFIWSCIYILRKKGKKELLQNQKWIEQIPSMLSTFGVLGTFIGITVGLYDFDPTPDQLQNSITTLLGGLKTAFVTSLLGMTCSLILNRIVNHALDTSHQERSESAIATLKLTEAIKELQHSNENKSTELIAAVKNLKENDTLKQLHLDVMQLKDDVEEIKGSHEYMRELQTKDVTQVADISKHLNTVCEEIEQIRAIAMTSTASVAKIDNITDTIHKEIGNISEEISHIAEDIEEQKQR